MTGQTAVDPAPSNPSKENSEFALEVVTEPSGEALLRVLNPLQKLAIAPRSVRAETSASGIEMFIELQVDATRQTAEQLRRQISAELLVNQVELLVCRR